MGILFRYELKKLLSRKLVWLLFAVCLFFVIYQDIGYFSKDMAEEVRGMRDIYARYQGRAVTDALQAEAQKAYEEYVAAHPERFRADDQMEEGKVFYWPVDSGYDAGVWQAYEDITHSDTVENRQKRVEDAKRWLATGEYDNGRKLTADDRESCESTIAFGAPSSVVRYAHGWSRLLHTYTPTTSVFTFFVLGIALISLFSNERSAKMENVMLSSARRGTAAAAKMLAAFCVAGATAALFYGLNITMPLVAYGFDGAEAPLMDLMTINVTLPVGAVFGQYLLLMALIAVSVAALIALASALFKHPVPVLLAVGALIAVQIVGLSIVNNLEVSIGLRYFVETLPANLMTDPFLYLFKIDELKNSLYMFGLPLLILALCFWLAPRIFLKRRKA